MTKFVHNLCIELVVTYDRIVVNISPRWDVKADVAATSRRVAERMLIVGGRQERGVSRTVILALAEDRAAVHLHLGESLFEFALLGGSHVGELVDVDVEVVGECHLCVKLVAEVDVVEEVHTEWLGKEPDGEGTLAASLMTDEYWHRLIAVEHIHLEPVCDG